MAACARLLLNFWADGRVNLWLGAGWAAGVLLAAHRAWPFGEGRREAQESIAGEVGAVVLPHALKRGGAHAAGHSAVSYAGEALIQFGQIARRMEPVPAWKSHGWVRLDGAVQCFAEGLARIWLTRPDATEAEAAREGAALALVLVKLAAWGAEEGGELAATERASRRLAQVDAWLKTGWTAAAAAGAAELVEDEADVRALGLLAWDLNRAASERTGAPGAEGEARRSGRVAVALLASALTGSSGKAPLGDRAWSGFHGALTELCRAFAWAFLANRARATERKAAEWAAGLVVALAKCAAKYAEGGEEDAALERAEGLVLQWADRLAGRQAPFGAERGASPESLTEAELEEPDPFVVEVHRLTEADKGKPPPGALFEFPPQPESARDFAPQELAEPAPAAGWYFSPDHAGRLAWFESRTRALNALSTADHTAPVVGPIAGAFDVAQRLAWICGNALSCVKRAAGEADAGVVVALLSADHDQKEIHEALTLLVAAGLLEVRAEPASAYPGLCPAEAWQLLRVPERRPGDATVAKIVVATLPLGVTS